MSSNKRRSSSQSTTTNIRTRLELIDSILEETSSRELNVDDCSILSNKLLDKHSKLFSLLDLLKELEKGLGPKLPSRTSRCWKQYFEWLESTVDDKKATEGLGDYSSFVEIIDHDDPIMGSGLRAKKAFKKGDRIFSIVKSAMIMSDTSTMDSALADFVENDPIAKSMTNISMTLHLLNEYCKKSSYWSPYLAALPSSYSTPLYLDRNELEVLRFSSHLHNILKMIRSVARQYAYFSKKIATIPKSKLCLKNSFTYEFYCWGVSTVATRQNAISLSFEADCFKKPCPSLIPLLDMCNHKFGEFCADYDAESGTVSLHAMEDIEAGDEVFLYYGTRSSGEFFVHNGFVPDPTQMTLDHLPIGVSLNTHEDLYQQRLALCHMLGMGQSSRDNRLYVKDSQIDETLVKFMVVFYASKQELESIKASQSPIDLVSNIVLNICSQLMKQQVMPDNIYEKDTLFCRSVALRLTDQIKSFLCQRSKILLKFLNTNQQHLDSGFSTKTSINIISKLVDSERLILSSYVS